MRRRLGTAITAREVFMTKRRCHPAAPQSEYAPAQSRIATLLACGVCTLAGLTGCGQNETCVLIGLPDGLVVDWADEELSLGETYDVTIEYDEVSATLRCDTTEASAPRLISGTVGERSESLFECNESSFSAPDHPSFVRVLVTDYQAEGFFEGAPALDEERIANANPDACELEEYEPLRVDLSLREANSFMERVCGEDCAMGAGFSAGANIDLTSLAEFPPLIPSFCSYEDMSEEEMQEVAAAGVQDLSTACAYPLESPLDADPSILLNETSERYAYELTRALAEEGVALYSAPTAYRPESVQIQLDSLGNCSALSLTNEFIVTAGHCVNDAADNSSTLSGGDDLIIRREVSTNTYSTVYDDSPNWNAHVSMRHSLFVNDVADHDIGAIRLRLFSMTSSSSARIYSSYASPPTYRDHFLYGWGDTNDLRYGDFNLAQPSGWTATAQFNAIDSWSNEHAVPGDSGGGIGFGAWTDSANTATVLQSSIAAVRVCTALPCSDSTYVGVQGERTPDLLAWLSSGTVVSQLGCDINKCTTHSANGFPYVKCQTDVCN